MFIGIVALAMACGPRSTPTPTATPAPTDTLVPTPTATPPALRMEDLRVVDQRQLTSEGDGLQSLLWWSGDGSEYIAARDPSHWTQLQRSMGLWDRCGNDYVRGSYVWRVRADGSREYLVESLDSPSVSPDGRLLLYTSRLECKEEQSFARALALLDLGTLEKRPLSEWTGRQLTSPPWLSGGSAAVLLISEGGIWTVGTDGTFQHQMNDLWAGAPSVVMMMSASVSPDGKRLTYLERSVADAAAGMTLWSADMDGGNQRKLASGAMGYLAAWSPDSSRLAYVAVGESLLHIVTFKAEGTSEEAFELETDEPGESFGGPIWSPDGSLLALPYRGQQVGNALPTTSIYVINADGTGLRRLVSLEFMATDPEWSADGRTLFVEAPRGTSGGADLWALALDDASAGHLPKAVVSLYVRDDPAPVPPDLYVYLEPEGVSDALKLDASPTALAQEGMALARTRQELEAAVGPDTTTIVLNREGVGEVDPAWLRAQYEAGKLIYGVWVDGTELKDLLNAQAPATLYRYAPRGEFLHGYLKKNPEGNPTSGTGRGTLGAPRVTLYALMEELSGRDVSLADLRNAPRRPGGPPPTPTPLPTPRPLPTLEGWAVPTPDPRLQGRIYFVSDMEAQGDSELYVMNADGTDVTRLTSDWPGGSGVSLSPDGTKVIFNSTVLDKTMSIYVTNLDGSNLSRLTSNKSFDLTPTWSPDGSRIAYSSQRGGPEDIYVMKADGSGEKRLTSAPGFERDAAWSPDGGKIAFSMSTDGRYDIYVMDADGGNQTRLTGGGGGAFEPAWSPDGRRIAFTRDHDVYAMNADGSEIARLTDDPGNDGTPVWSPGGEMIAFTSDRDGMDEIYVMNADGSEERRLTGNTGSDCAFGWRR